MKPDLKYFEDYLGCYGFTHFKKLIFAPPLDGYELTEDQARAINYLIKNHDWEWIYSTGKELIKIPTPSFVPPRR